MENKFIILVQYGISVEPCYWGEDERPVLFDTEEEAKKTMDDDFAHMVQRQKEEVLCGDRDVDMVDEECEEWVSPCTVDENGCISTPNDGEIYNPKTFVR